MRVKNILLFIFLLIGNHAFAQFREEIGTLETMYEARARAVLNTVLRPFEYSLVVSVDIDRDESRLKKLEKDLEEELLPGMPSGLGSSNPSFANQLYEMKNRVDIHLVLSNKVSKEKEKTISNILLMKLHLDEKSGDSLAISRTEMPSFEETSGSVLPELSWKMWGMILGILLLLASLLVYYLTRKPKAEHQSQPGEEQPEKEDKKAEVAPDKEESHQVQAQNEESTIEIDTDEILFEEKQQIVSLATQYPIATAQALTAHFMSGQEKDILILCDTFGWQTAKKLFAEFSPRIWGKLGILLQDKQKFKDSEVLEAFQTCGKIILKKFLEIGELDLANPFGFFWKLSNQDRKKLLVSESAVNIALLCFHGNKDQVEELMEGLNQETSEAVTVAISRMDHFTDQQIRALVETLMKKWQLIAQNPEKVVDGIEMAAQLLRSLPAEKEIPFFRKLAEKNPIEADKIRQTILLYPDIELIPKEIVGEAVGLMELSVVSQALRDEQFASVRLAVLKALPPKKSFMIEKDLGLNVMTSEKEIALSQREMIHSIMIILKLKKLTLTQVLSKKVDKNESDDAQIGVLKTA